MRFLVELWVLAIVTCVTARQSNSVLDFLRNKTDEKPTPIVLWHGMGDCCCNPLSMGWLKKVLEREIPGVYVHSLMIGDNVVSDTEHGFFGNMNDLVRQACEMIAKDVRLKDGYHAVGFSQGGLFLRAVAQRCPSPSMRNLISIGGPQQGVYGLPHCPAEARICDAVRHLLDIGAYVSYVQETLVQAQYWHDPVDESGYKEHNIFLADANAENAINRTYSDNLAKLQNFVLVKFLKDSMVVPKESEWFGYYAGGGTSTIIPLEKSKLYTEDRIGLRTLGENGKLHFVSIDGDHLQIPESVFIQEIVNKFLK